MQSSEYLFLLPGHAKLQREINALYHLQKAARHSEARCKEDDNENAATNIIINYWQRCSLMQIDTSEMHLPGKQEQWPEPFWRDMLVQINATITRHHKIIRQECLKAEQENIRKFTEKAQSDFDARQRPRMCKAALMRNPPHIPLWGVVSQHPTQVVCEKEVQDVTDELGPKLAGVCCLEQHGTGTKITCERRSDVSDVVSSLEAGTCVVLKQEATLVATPEEKLCGTEHFFGTNALGALPTCAVHTNASSKDLHCLS